MKRHWGLGALALLSLLVALSTSAKVAAGGEEPVRTKVILTYGVPVGASSDQSRTQAAQAVQELSGTVSYEFRHIPVVAAEVPTESLYTLKTDPRIARVELDGVIQALDLELDNSWGVARIGAGLVHSFNKGTGVNVAIVDTGVDPTHFDLDGNFVGGFDFVNNDGDPTDDNGHGTHVAGIVCAEDNDVAASVVGVAPECNLYAYKVLDGGGFGLWSDLIAALDRSITDGIQVVNMSLGGSSAPAAVRDAMVVARDAGIVLVAAAGNLPLGAVSCPVGFPAAYPEVIAVAATNAADQRASFSCTGPQVELSAPGVSITSTFLGGSFVALSGTSMASPHGAGLAALVIASGISDQNGNGRINDEVRQRMQATADDLGAAGRDEEFGFGILDAQEAVLPPPANQHPVVTITSPADGASFAAGATVNFAGTALDFEDGDISANLAWTSSIDGAIGGGAGFSRTLGSGAHTIGASVTDSGGVMGSTTVAVFVELPPSPPPPPPPEPPPAETPTFSPDSFTIERGTLLEGDLGRILQDDQQYLRIGSVRRNGRWLTEWFGTAHIPQNPLNVIALNASFDGSYDELVNQELYLFNFAAGEWDLIDTRQVGLDDVSVALSVPEFGFYMAEDGEVRLRARATHVFRRFEARGDFMEIGVTVGSGPLVDYFPSSLQFDRGLLVGGDPTRLFEDDQTYLQIAPVRRDGRWRSDWIGTSVVGNPGVQVAAIEIAYDGGYTNGSALQELFIFDLDNQGWRLIDSRDGVSADEAVLWTTGNVSRYLSAGGEVRLRVRSEGALRYTAQADLMRVRIQLFPPAIDVSPLRFEETVIQGDVVDRTMTISSVGRSELTFEITDRVAAPPEPSVPIRLGIWYPYSSNDGVPPISSFTARNIDASFITGDIDAGVLAGYDVLFLGRAGMIGNFPSGAGVIQDIDALIAWVDAGGGIIGESNALVYDSDSWRGTDWSSRLSVVAGVSGPSGGGDSGTSNLSVLMTNPAHSIAQGLPASFTLAGSHAHLFTATMDQGKNPTAVEVGTVGGTSVIAAEFGGGCSVYLPTAVGWSGMDWPGNPDYEALFLNAVEWLGSCGGAPPPVGGAFLEIRPTEGAVAPGASQAILLRADSTGVEPGSYERDIVIDSNDREEPRVVVLYTLHVQAPAPAVDAGPGLAANEGSVVDLVGTTTDPGFAGAHTATIDWGDGTVEPGAVNEIVGATSTPGTVTGSHAYADNASYTVTVTVERVSGLPGSLPGSGTTTAAIANVAPIVEAGPNASTTAGVVMSLAPATFSDPGFDCPACAPPSQEDFTATIDWGDGATNTGAVAETPGGPGAPTTGTVSGSHVYAAAGTFTVQVCATDDDGGTGCDTLQVNVGAAIPAMAASLNSGPANTVVSVDGTGFAANETPITVTFDGVAVITTPAIIKASSVGAWTANFSVPAGPIGSSTIDAFGPTTPASAVPDVVFTVTAALVAPAISVDAGPDLAATEGSSATLQASVTGGAGALADGSATVAWGDGAVDVRDGPAATGAIAASHSYADDGIYEVTLCVDDGGGRSACDTALVTVDNVAPAMSAIGPISGVEGQAVAVSGSFIDSGTADIHAVTVYWGDGSSRPAATSEGGGFGTFSADHTYAGSGVFTVRVCVADDDGGTACRTTTATIANAAPTVTASADVSGVEGNLLSVAAVYGDSGAGDSHAATVDWGDGASSSGVVDRRSGTVRATHAYSDDGVYAVIICVADSDGASGCDTLTATVVNAAPEVWAAAEGADSLEEGRAVTVSGIITDGGVSDTHTAIVDWGDGISSGATVVAGTVIASHIYGDEGSYPVQVCVTDDDGAEGCASIEMQVNNVAPSVSGWGEGAPSAPTPVGEAIDLQASFSDPGWQDSHSAIIDWGDGAVVAIAVTMFNSSAPDARAGVVAGSHVYGVAGTYAVTVVITDDDGGATSQTTFLDVTSGGLGGGNPAKEPEQPEEYRLGTGAGR